MEGYETREEAASRVRAERRERPHSAGRRCETRRGLRPVPEDSRSARPARTHRRASTFAQLALEMAPRMPRDATIIAILPRVPVETAVALGTLRRQGFAVTAILIGLDETQKLEAHGRLLAETVRDIRYVNTEEELAHFGGNTAAPGPAAYAVDIPLA